ncbi:DUF6575 domain-containing protein [Vibrio splendidus]|uniref:DUF6575 domain-containing protein n=1 Tax=Vibrio splendidus TaxID=29497 RepID=UPI00352D07A9
MRTLIPENVLMYYDFPQVFIAKDNVDLRYVCMYYADDESDHPKFLCTPVSDKRCNQLRTGKIDLRSIYAEPEVPDFFDCNKENSSESLSISSFDFDICPEDLLPDSGLTFDISDELVNTSEALNSTIAYASLSVPEASDAPRIRSSKLADFLTVYQSVLKYLSKVVAKEGKVKIPKDDTPFDTDVFGFAHGSFTVKIKSSYDDMFGENPLLSGALSLLNEFLSSTDESDKALAFLRKNKGLTAGSLIKLLEFMNKNSCSLKHSWSSPNLDQAYIANTSIDKIASLYELCLKTQGLTTESVVIEGVFTLANTQTNAWKLIDTEGQVHSGNIKSEENITLDGVVIKNKKYRLNCEESLEVVTGTSKEKTSLHLKSIECI